MRSRSKIVALAVATTALPVLPVPAQAQAEHARDEGPAPGVIPNMTSGPVQLPPVLPGQRASGAAFIGYRGSDGETTGAVVTLSPLAGAFVRVGAEVTPRSSEGDTRFLWGLGLEDWRDRTFFLHVHDWGPVRPGGPLTLREAEASFGYKLSRVCGGTFCLASSAFATLPFAGGPFLGARATVTIARTWFVSTELGWTVPGVLQGSGAPPAWRPSFAFGRWDGRPGGLFVTYRDDLSTRQLDDWTRLERGGQGVLALGVNWAY